jgi:hypothetical protein
MTAFVVNFHNATQQTITLTQGDTALMTQSGPLTLSIPPKDTMLAYLITADDQGSDCIVPWTVNNNSRTVVKFHLVPAKSDDMPTLGIEGKGTAYSKAVCDSNTSSTDCSSTDQTKWPQVFSDPATVDIYFGLT